MSSENHIPAKPHPYRNTTALTGPNTLGKMGPQPRFVTDVLREYIPLSGGTLESVGQVLGCTV